MERQLQYANASKLRNNGRVGEREAWSKHIHIACGILLEKCDQMDCLSNSHKSPLQRVKRISHFSFKSQ